MDRLSPEGGPCAALTTRAVPRALTWRRLVTMSPRACLLVPTVHVDVDGARDERPHDGRAERCGVRDNEPAGTSGETPPDIAAAYETCGASHGDGGTRDG